MAGLATPGPAAAAAQGPRGKRDTTRLFAWDTVQ